MKALLQHLLSPAFLYAQSADPAGNWTPYHLAWAAALGLGLYLGAILHSRGVRVACAVSLALLAAQRMFGGLWSARVWALSSSGVALLLVVEASLRRRHVVALWRWRRWLAGDIDHSTGSAWAPRVVWIGMHAVALAFFCPVDRVGWWPAALAALCLVTASWVARRTTVHVLLPLLLAYVGGGLRLLVGGLLGVAWEPYLAYPYPDVWSPWFDSRVTWLAACGGMVGVTLAVCQGSKGRGRPRRPEIALTIMLALAVWYGAVVARHVTRGTGGSDPLGYLQMAADIVERGTPEHTFPLAGVARSAGVPVWPVVPVGYRPPAVDRAASVWPPAWSAMLAPLYAVGGERLALLGAPLFALLGTWLTWRLARQLQPEPHGWAATLAAGISITSYEAVTRSLVPMADAAASALGLAMLLGLARAHDTGAWRWSVLAGAAWGLAFDVRHPLLPLGVAALPAVLLTDAPWLRRMAHLTLFGGAALLCALPDLAYHARVLGSPWATESAEWGLISWRNIATTARALAAQDLLRRNEWGYLWGVVILGAVVQARRSGERWQAATMWAGLAPVVLFHLSYQALRLRDLLFLFPWLAVWAARGASAVWSWARGHRGAYWVAALGLAMALAARTAHTLAIPWSERISVFGHMSAQERGAFSLLAGALPERAVVATGISAGAVERYAGCLAFRPASWTEEEFDRFVSALDEAGYLLYLLNDGEEMSIWCATVDRCRSAVRLGTYAVPTYGLGGQDWGMRAVLWAAPRGQH